VIAVTAELARWIEAETGRRASVIGTGANESLFVPADACGSPVEGLPEQYVVFFGSFAPWQEIPVLLAAVEHVSWPTDVSLVLVGDGPLNDEVARAASRNPRVIRLGPLPYSEVGRVVARSLCSMVLKSESYQTGPSPVKLYESMSCGVPVIATDIPGVRSVVADHDCGILLEHNTPSLVAAAVARIAARPDEAEQMGARGRAAVMRHYSWRARAFATAGVVAAAIDAAGPETIPATSSAL
jgi:glycosyltransferase involved in cell wall biosynthesis